ncbi:hypothetical protein FQR65_LT00863 [Abscondita terminalis]|nr:hypothetical protein FQR65_LT00863 [Abscondita terminalis]
MSPKLYCWDSSAPVRSVYLTAAALNLKLERVLVNLRAGEQMNPEYIKINPQHTVPTLIDDDGTCIWDSHAIMAYLTSKYGKDDSLYPKDLAKRALIDQRLHFDSGKAFPVVQGIAKPILYSGSKTIPEHWKTQGIQVYEFLEKFLENNLWMAGQTLTLADLSLLSTITALDFLVPIDEKKFPNLVGWIKRGEKLPYYKCNEEGLNSFKDVMKKKLGL